MNDTELINLFVLHLSSNLSSNRYPRLISLLILNSEEIQEEIKIIFKELEE